MIPDRLAVGPRCRGAVGDVKAGIGGDGRDKGTPQRVVEKVPRPDPAIAEEEKEAEQEQRVGDRAVRLGREGGRRCTPPPAPVLTLGSARLERLRTGTAAGGSGGACDWPEPSGRGTLAVAAALAVAPLAPGWNAKRPSGDVETTRTPPPVPDGIRGGRFG